MASDANRAAAKKRMASDANRAATKKRLASDANKAADRRRKKMLRQRTLVEKGDGLHSTEVIAGTLIVPDLDETDDSIGQMNKVCKFCHALKFPKETPNLCCNKGKIQLKPFPKPPKEFLDLYKPNGSEQIERSRVFKKFIRPLNNGLCLSSIKANERLFHGYTPTVIFQGQVHQFAGPLQAREGANPVFSQLYILDPSLETSTRFANLRLPANISDREKIELCSIMEILQNTLKDCNPFIKDYRQIISIADADLANGKLVISAKARPRGEHERRYNSPVCLEEVSLLTVKGKHDLIITKTDGRLEIVSEQNQSAMPLHHTLLFPTGAKGWHPDLKQSPESNKRLTCREFTTWHLNVRKEGTYDGVEFVNYIHYGGKAFQEWMCLQWLISENMKLNWMDLNQKQVRADTYQNISSHLASVGDALHLDDHRPQVGQKILNKSLVGSPRWYNDRYHNAMAIVKKYKKPNYFITMTCNPNWPEIKDNLLPGQTAQDRNDLTARVFRLKKDQLLHDLIKGGLFGRRVAYLGVVEFQKRGLPHCHILLIIADEDELHTDEDVDKVISAELPADPNEPGLSEEQRAQRERLQTIVATNMIHGPCGSLFPSAPCMKDGKCEKGFPKPFQAHSVLDSNCTYATYRRRSPTDGGRTLKLTRRGVTFTADNSMVVPYSPYLTLRYNCHINVELCASILSCKYVFKYTTKGPDRLMVSTELEGNTGPRDEIENYKDMRCVGSCEAAWKLFQFPIATQFPSVKGLRVHLEDHQMVVFQEGNEEGGLARSRQTELTAFFDLNKGLKEQGMPVDQMPMYANVPEDFCWDKNTKQWKPRQRYFGQTIGRVHSIPHTAGDVFYLRMLLNHEHSRGKESFTDMLTLPSGVCETYKQVCQQLGLLQSDGEWNEVLQEAVFVCSSQSLRALYVTILIWSAPADPKALFDAFWTDWTDDFVYQAESRKLDESQQKTLVLHDIGNRLLQFEKQLRDFSLTEPSEADLAAVSWFIEGHSAIISEELDFNPDTVREESEQYVSLYTDEQRAVHNRVLEAVRGNKALQLYVNAKGGCGKTFLLNGILQTIRGLEPGGCVALAMATTGIAAMLLENGRTFHSRLKAPLNPDDQSMLRILAQSELAKLVQMAKILAIDEVTMLDNLLMAALNRSLQDIMGNNLPFGGKVIVFSGDLRQCLPVVPGASRAGIVERCINQCPLFQHFEVMWMEKNLRVNAGGNEHLIGWDNLITSIGNGTFGTMGPDGDIVTLPSEMCEQIEANTVEDKSRETSSMRRLVEKVFPDLKRNISDPNWLEGRAILTPTNRCVDGINDWVVAHLPDPSIKLYSADQVDDLQDSRGFSLEYMNGLNPTGLPRHCVELKPNIPLMLIRNLDPRRGLCNGTRLIFKKMSNNGRLLICDYTLRGETKEVAIPRIVLKPKDKEFPFDWSRRQFPVRVAFSCTINKSQGQSLKSVGIWLPNPVFSHGQLYVALSRVSDPALCFVAIKPLKDQPPNATRNIVFKEVLMGCVPGVQPVDDGIQQPSATLSTNDVEGLAVDDLEALWIDYEGIEDVFDNLEEDFMGPSLQLAPQAKICQTNMSPSLPANVGQLPPKEPEVAFSLGEQPELGEYDKLCESKIDALRTTWLEHNGVEFPNTGDIDSN